MNTKAYTSISFVSALAVGVMLPVTSLLILAKGFSYAQLSASVAVYSAAVILMEMPSGILADAIGRKKTFLLSQAMQLIGLCLLFGGRHIGVMYLASGISGIGRAFGSGSFDALFIDRYLAMPGNKGLPRVTKWLQAGECAGLAAGSLLSGGLMQLSLWLLGDGAIYVLPALCRFLLLSLVVLLTAAFVKPEAAATANASPAPSESILTGVKRWWRLFASMFAFGLVLSALETYGAPFLRLYTTESQTWLLGVLSFIAFAGSVTGNLLGEKITRRLSNAQMFWVSRFLLAAAVILLSLQQRASGIVLLYGLAYLLCGIGNLGEGIWLGELIPPDKRATYMSVQSLFFQLGCMASSAVSGIMLARAGMGGVWRVMTAGLVAVLVVAAPKGKDAGRDAGALPQTPPRR